MAAIAAIMVAILAAIFNMVAKTHKKFQVLQCSNYKEN
jgi:conjugal transfer/entry exclusion protein